MAAAFAVALCAKPRDIGPAETTFLTADLSYEPDGDTPAVEFDCRDDGKVMITRHGLRGLTQEAVVALAVTRAGFDISIEERITPQAPAIATPANGDGADTHPGVNTATFLLDGLGRERYHIKYNSDATSSFAALTVRNIPGLHAWRPLG